MGITTPSRRRTATLISAILAGSVLLSGCGGSSDSAENSSAADAPAAAPAQGGGAATTERQQQGQDSPAESPDLRIDQRAIVYTGSITVRVEDVNAKAAEALGIATGAGGFIGEDNRTTNGGSGSASMTLRVPADKFSAVVEQVAKLGKEETRNISTQDVTEETVDLDARITVQQARVDSGRRLLSQAKSLSDLVMLEREVATRESDLASLQAKKRRLADLTALSTITVTLLGPNAAATTPDDSPPGFLAGLQGGWNALLASLAILVTVLGALLPWLIAIGLPIWAVLYALRRWRSKNPKPEIPAPAPLLPAYAPAGPPPRRDAPTEENQDQ